MFLSEIIQESSERVWENQTIENFWVNNKTGIEKSTRRVSEDISNYKIIRKNYFAYNPYRINVWSIGLFDWKLWAVSTAYVVFKVDENKIIPSLLLNFLKSKKWLIEINQHTHGWVRKTLSFDDLWKIEIDIPSIEKQIDFVKGAQKDSVIIEKIQNMNFENQDFVKRLRKSFLQDAIQGRFIMQDANDEPANNLLKKIMKEKEQLIKEKKIKRFKNIIPISEADVIFELPKNWEWTRLGDIIYTATDWPHYSPDYVDKWKWIMFLSARNIKIWSVDLSDVKYVSYDDHKEFTKRTKPEKWDILYTKWWTTWIAKINDLENEFSVRVHVALLKFNQILLSNKYLELALNSPHCYEQSQKYTQWISNRDLWLTRMINITIPLPPLAEQKRIVAKVDELMNLCDQLEAQVNEAKENGEKLMESVLSEVFR